MSFSFNRAAEPVLAAWRRGYASFACPFIRPPAGRFADATLFGALTPETRPVRKPGLATPVASREPEGWLRRSDLRWRWPRAGHCLLPRGRAWFETDRGAGKRL